MENKYSLDKKKEEERTSEDDVELLFDKIASTDDLVSWPESELDLLLLDEWPAPFDLCASAARSHICNKYKAKAMLSYKSLKLLPIVF